MIEHAGYHDARQQIVSRRRRALLFRLHVGIFTIGLILFFFWLRTQPFGDPAFLIPPAAWAFLLIGHGFFNGWVNERDEAAERLWDNLYGSATTGSRNMQQAAPTTYEDIRAVVEVELIREKIKRRRLLFRINLAAYLAVMLMAWIVIPVFFGPFLTSSSSLSIFLLSFGGLAEVVLHYIAYRLDTVDGERGMRERLLGRALSGHMEGAEEKAKGRMQLTEDGELLEIADNDTDDLTFDTDTAQKQHMNG